MLNIRDYIEKADSQGCTIRLTIKQLNEVEQALNSYKGRANGLYAETMCNLANRVKSIVADNGLVRKDGNYINVNDLIKCLYDDDTEDLEYELSKNCGYEQSRRLKYE